MKTNDLIFESTVGMNREQWLEFRKPLNHVYKFLEQWLKDEVIHVQDLQAYLRSPQGYTFLQYIFDQQEWKDFTFPTVGASEISSIVGLNQYQSVIELYYEKVGVKQTVDIDNAAMFWGKELEAAIAEKWQYWEGNEESLFQNFKGGKVVRKCRRLNAYVRNVHFPWIFCSLDRVINQYAGKTEGSLECKTISGWVSNLWENGIPPMYVAQLQTQLAVCGFDHGEIAILKDGRDFQVYPFDYSASICERLVSESLAFFRMVKSGIEQYLLYKAAPDQHAQQNHLARIDQFSPEPDGSLAYESYLKGAYKEQGYEVFGGPVELHLAHSYKHYDKQMKEIESMQRECSNKLKAFLKDAAKIDFGSEGQVTWKANAKGSRVFLCKVNPPHDFQPDPEIVKSEGTVKIEETPLPFD